MYCRFHRLNQSILKKSTMAMLIEFHFKLPVQNEAYCFQIEPKKLLRSFRLQFVLL